MPTIPLAAGDVDEVFVINDVNLRIPPTSIKFRSEDLIYSWKTLRSKTSTKIPSGHGQSRVTVTIIFTDDLLLAMHRLVVEFKHSPFCQIENRYLRESMCGDWPDRQMMAFTLMNCTIYPAPGKTDAWVMELDLTWFNYFPFMPNFIYRDDWVTQWIREGANWNRYTIGWDVVDGVRRARAVIAEHADQIITGDQSIDTFDVVTETIRKKEFRSVDEMEILHEGQVFDLLPRPSKMEPARFVWRCSDSRIYTRYINYLQRDALKDNFGIDVEADIATSVLGQEGIRRYFGVGRDKQNQPITLPLHLIDYRVHQGWIGQMLKFNQGIVFGFDLYKSVQLPPELTTKQTKTQMTLLDQIIQEGRKTAGYDTTVPVTDGPGSVPVRQGYTNPNGKRIPIRENIADFIHAEVPNGYVKWRTASELAGIYGDSTRAGRMHYGTDVGCRDASGAHQALLVYPVEDGKVWRVTNFTDITGNWKYVELSSTGIQNDLSSLTAVLVPETGDIREDLLDSLVAAKFIDTSTRTRPDADRVVAVGTVVQSAAHASRLYYTDLKDGGISVIIRHSEFKNMAPSYSVYCHLSRIDVTNGQEVTKDTVIGRVGGTTTIDPAFIAWSWYQNTPIITPTLNPISAFRSPSGENAASGLSTYAQQLDLQLDGSLDHLHSHGAPDNTVKVFNLSPHLHFEYWEPKDAAVTAIQDNATTNQTNTGYGQATHIVVDPRISYATSETQDGVQIVKSVAEQYKDASEAVSSALKEATDKGLIDNSQGELLKQLFISLRQQGWIYYEENRNVQNVWRHPLLFPIAKSNIEGTDIYKRMLAGMDIGDGTKSIFISDDCVFTGCSASLQHVVAQIPLLSQEYPTQQHLGSMEPSFTFQFHILDDRDDLQGIGETGLMLQGMRSKLQYNAREFRPVLDGWCCMTDTFLTRLLGTTLIKDLDNEANTAKIHKRTMIARSGGGTVEGNPGLSILTFEMEETNPYTSQTMISDGDKLPDVEEARRKVLDALYHYQVQKPALKPGEQLILDKFDKFSLTGTGLYEFAGTAEERSMLLRDIPGASAGTADLQMVTPDDISYGSASEVFLPLDAVKQVRGAALKTKAYRDFLFTITSTAELILAEESLGGLFTEETKHQLYDLPITPHMWQGFQNYLDVYIHLVGTNVDILRTNAKYLHAMQDVPNALDASSWAVVDSAAYAFSGTANPWRDGVVYNSTNIDPTIGSVHILGVVNPHYAQDVVDDVSNVYLNVPYRVVSSLLSSSPSWSFKGFAQQDNDTFRMNFCKNYLAWFPLVLGFVGESQVAFNSYVEDKFKWVGDAIMPDLFGGGAANPEFQGLLDGLFKYIQSTNLLFYSATDRRGFIADRGSALIQQDGHWGIEANYTAPKTIEGTIWSAGGLFNNDAVDFGNLPTNSPAEYTIIQAQEQSKVRFIKDLLARLADELRADIEVLTELGLSELALIDITNQYRGSECYPDLVLPFHPYYRDNFNVSPDFFFWNAYEDGGTLAKEATDQIYNSLYVVLKNCHDSLAMLQKGVKYDASQGLVQDVNATEDALRFTAEGSDDVLERTGEDTFVSHGATGYPTAMTAQASVDESTFYTAWEHKTDKTQFTTYQDGKLVSSQTPPKITTHSSQAGISTETYAVKLGVTDGNPQYRQKAGLDTYQALWKKLGSTEQMFGSRAGYLGQYLTQENLDSLKTTQTDTAMASQAEYAHGYNLDFLKSLARDSSKDMLGQKMSMRRAFPTFKLYFVEEDEQETRYINFDDFYSYNQVKSIAVVLSRTMSADTAVLQIQNVAGTLDGSMRDVITDLDYFDKSKDKQTAALSPDSSILQDSPVQNNSTSDQPFGQLVLRPGLNVQVRLGYSNDPDALEVMLSGRVVDVMWNSGGDMAEITIQGFGAELEQQIKGVDHQQSGTGVVYNTTHQLLCSMMLEPELAHFGRWEFGQLYQTGESQDARLDFVDYSRDTLLSKFSVTRAMTRFVSNHPYIVAALSFGLIVSQFIPLPETGLVSKVLGTVAGTGTKAVVLDRALVSSSLQLVRTAEEMAADGAPIFRESMLDLVSGAFAKGLKMETTVALKEFISANIPATTMEVLRTGTADGVQLSKEELSAFFSTIVTDLGNAAETRVNVSNFFNQTAFAPMGIQDYLTAGVTLFSRQAGLGSLRDFGRAAILNPALVTGGLLGLGLSGDAGEFLLNSTLGRLYRATVGNINKSFVKTTTSLMLTPQDDNIFAPSPKDYMTVKPASWTQTFKDYGAYIAGGILGQSDEKYQMLRGYLFPNMILERRLDPEQCEYTIAGSTIWDIFQEMTLRHPGWIAGTRPYGRDFRYTMFFGVPSQRYWSKPAPNRFIDRMNKLRAAIGQGAMTEEAYIALYGAETEDGEPLDVWKERLRRGHMGHADYEVRGTFEPGVPTSGPVPWLISHEDAVEDLGTESTYYTTRALKEYLKGLDLRFVPFRRYHCLTSQRDIVENRIMGSEDSVINSIDVAYYEVASNASTVATPYGTTLIKANSTIPESMIRTSPMNLPNCKGYTMSLRYGVGALLQSMRSMYRGELLIVGNARIRPSDICIVLDTYNDMVGPIEVDQVVHTFSHETGFITEIRPNAIVISNEISSWPMIEAMKMMSMAVQDAEKNYGQQMNNIPLDYTLDALFGKWGSGRVAGIIEEKYHSEQFFGADGADIKKDVFGAGQPVPDFGAIDGITAAAGHRVANITIPEVTSILAGVLLPIYTLNSVEGFEQDGLFLPENHPAFAAKSGTNTVLTINGEPKNLVVLTADTLMNPPSFTWLIAAPILLAKCLREDAIMIVPLMKNGNPIISGMTLSDPATIWRSFIGDLRNYADDALKGITHAASLYDQYGTTVWRQLGEPDFTDVIRAAASGNSLQDITGVK